MNNSLVFQTRPLLPLTMKTEDGGGGIVVNNNKKKPLIPLTKKTVIPSSLSTSLSYNSLKDKIGNDFFYNNHYSKVYTSFFA